MSNRTESGIFTMPTTEASYPNMQSEPRRPAVLVTGPLGLEGSSSAYRRRCFVMMNSALIAVNFRIPVVGFTFCLADLKCSGATGLWNFSLKKGRINEGMPANAFKTSLLKVKSRLVSSRTAAAYACMLDNNPLPSPTF